MADHLTARQTAGTNYGQHSLSTLTGLYYASSGIDPALSQIRLPRCGQVGAPLVDKNVRVATTAYNGAAGVTLEAVYRNAITNFNFFGGIWTRAIVRWYGGYGYNVDMFMTPTNDSISDTTGRATIGIGDAGGTWINSRTVHSRPVISNNQPHHIAVVFDAPPATTARVYVDGALVESVTTTAPCASFSANDFYASAEAFFTHSDGDISHMCASPALPANEIRARANLVTDLAGRALTDQGRVMAWDADVCGWVPVTNGYSGSSWIKVKQAATQQY